MAIVNSFALFAGATYPAESDVLSTAPTYGDSVNVLNGSFTPGSGSVPGPDDVRAGVATGLTVGNMTLPAVDDVRQAVQYGANGTEYTGTLVNNVIPTPPGGTICRLKVQISLNGQAIDDAVVTCTLCEANSIVPTNLVPSVTPNFVKTIGGYAEIDLYRQAAFTRGNGLYQIEVKHNNQILCSMKAAMPDQAEVYLNELVDLTDPNYTGG